MMLVLFIFIFYQRSVRIFLIALLIAVIMKLIFIILEINFKNSAFDSDLLP